jgi:hypothetical protein
MRERDSPISTSAASKPETELSALKWTSRRGFLKSGAAAAFAQRAELERDCTGARQLGLRR